MSTGQLKTRVYGGFRGVDFRGDEAELTRSPDSLNMWRDYKKTAGICTRPAMELYSSYSQPIYGIYFFTHDDTEMMLVHRGTNIYKVTRDETGAEVKEGIYYGVSNGKSAAFVYDGKWYFKDEKHYLCYDGESIGDVVGYIPTTSISRTPTGGGDIYQDVNLLSDYRINEFIATGSHRAFYLDAKDIDSEAPQATVDGEAATVSSYNADEGKVVLETAPAEGSKVVITFKKTADKSKILNCTMLAVFDNRVFFSGNPDYPNKLWHSSLEDPTYFSDLDYYDDGMGEAEIKGMVAANNNLWVFREPSQENTTIFYHTPVTDNTYGKIYPSVHSSISTGCIGKAINFNDDIVFFSDRGMEGINGDITTEQVISHRSSLVDRRLLEEAGYKKMLLAEWEGYLLVIIGKRIYLADSRAMLQNENGLEYEWFYWEMDKEALCAVNEKGVLYIGTDDGIYTLTDNEGSLESYWVTPKDKFGHPQYLKTTNKRGCVVEAEGDFSLLAKTEKTDFSVVGSYENIGDYVTCRIKKKKFKDIQLKFMSNTRFSLEQITLGCYIGGFIKR